MSDDETVKEPRPPLSEAAKRALAEAKARRGHPVPSGQRRPWRRSRRGGLEPGRYGDWEIKGLTSDF